jgi:hypothetical protein
LEGGGGAGVRRWGGGAFFKDDLVRSALPKEKKTSETRKRPAKQKKRLGLHASRVITDVRASLFELMIIQKVCTNDYKK